MLPANFAKLLVLQFLRHQLLILTAVIHAAFALLAFQLDQVVLGHVSNAKCKSQSVKLQFKNFKLSFFILIFKFSINYEPTVRIELTTYSLPWSCSAAELHRRSFFKKNLSGQGGIRTPEGARPPRLQRGVIDHSTTCPEPAVRFGLTTCCLQNSCSTAELSRQFFQLLFSIPVFGVEVEDCCKRVARIFIITHFYINIAKLSV